MNDDFAAGVGGVDPALHLVQDLVGFDQRGVGLEFEVELHDVAGAAVPRSKVVKAEYLVMASGQFANPGAVRIRDLPVEKNIQRMRGDGPGAPGQVDSDGKPHQGIHPVQLGGRRNGHSGNHAQIHQEIGPVVQGIRRNRYRAGLATDVTLPAEERQGDHGGDRNDGNASQRTRY